MPDTCPICAKPLAPDYRVIAFDRPARVNVYAHGGRCQDTVRAWTRDDVLRYAGRGETAKAVRR